MTRILEENEKPEKSTRKRIDSIDVSQLEYTATTLFTYGTIAIAVIGVYASVIYLFVKQLKKD